MSAVIVSLCYIGAEDTFQKLDPERTFFKLIYQTHTNFAMQTTFSISKMNFGEQGQIELIRQGDMISNLVLNVTLPAIRKKDVGDANVKTICWTRKVGHALIKHIQLTIASQRVDKLTGTFIDIMSELTIQEGLRDGYAQMIGDIPELTKPKILANYADDDEVLPAYELFIPLPFWFTQDYGLSLPILALQFNNISLEVEYAKLDDLINFSSDVSTTVPNIQVKQQLQHKYLTDTVFLDVNERTAVAQMAHEYLIKQVQQNNEEGQSITGNSQSQSLQDEVRLNFNHSCLEFIVAFKLGAFNAGQQSMQKRNRFLVYNHLNDEQSWQDQVQAAAQQIVETAVLPNKAITAASGTTVPVVGYPSAYSATVPTVAVSGVNVVSTEQLVAIGTTGTAPINSFLLTYNNSQSNIFFNILYVNIAAGANAFHKTGGNGIFDVALHLLGNGTHEFMNQIQSATVSVVIEYNGDDATDNYVRLQSVLVENITTSISIRELSIPLQHFAPSSGISGSHDNRYKSASVNIQEYAPKYFFQYGLQLDGKGNPLKTMSILFNNQDRTLEYSGQYYNLYTNYRAHTRIPPNGIYTYPIALYPEAPFPSGSVNLSRVDNVQLKYQIEDHLRKDKQNVPILDMFTGTRLYIFGVVFNVFRIIGGMGGLLFGN